MNTFHLGPAPDASAPSTLSFFHRQKNTSTTGPTSTVSDTSSTLSSTSQRFDLRASPPAATHQPPHLLSNAHAQNLSIPDVPGHDRLVQEAASSLGIPYSILKSLHEQSERRKMEDVSLLQGISMLQAIIDDLRQRNHTQKVTLSEHETQIASFHETLHRREEEHQSRLQLLTTLTTQLEEEQAKVQRVLEQVRILEQELRISKEENATKDQIMTTMVKQHKDDRIDFDKKHEVHRAALTDYYTALLASLNKHYEEAQRAAAGLSDTVTALRYEIQGLKSGNETMTNSFMRVESVRISQLHIIAQLQKENADLRAKMSSNDEKHDALKHVFSESMLDLVAVEKTLAMIAADESAWVVQL